MTGSVRKPDYDEIWTVVDNPTKFELLSYLILCLNFPTEKIFKTPNTRDNKRDAEGIIGGKKFFLEAKFITDILKKKLSHKEVGSNIDTAIYELADTLLIYTNGDIQNDLINFINLHNDIQEAIFYRPIKIIAVPRRQVALLALRYNPEEYYNKLNDIEFTGYKSNTVYEIASRKTLLQEIGIKLIDDVSNFKSTFSNSFFHFPTFQALGESSFSLSERTEIIKSFIQIESFFSIDKWAETKESIKIPLGSTFSLIFKVNNFFVDPIQFSIEIQGSGAIKFNGSWKLIGDKYIYSCIIQGMSEEVIASNVRIERLPYNIADPVISIGSHQFVLPIGKVEVQNLFFLAPFIGERNNELLAFYKEKIDRVFYSNKFFLGLITGEAGVGKSRLIQEIIDHCSKYKVRLFHSELVASEGRRTLIREIIAFFIGVNADSFTSNTEQLLFQFKNDKNFASLFNDDIEFYSFSKVIDKVLATGLNNISIPEIDKVADFISKILLHLGEKCFALIVIEDLHHGDKRVFHFILRVYNYLKTKESKIAFLLAARTNIEYSTPSYREFELSISTDPTYSIQKTEISPLSDKDSLSFIKELVLTNSRFEEFIIQKILSRTGNNPFNIIHTLLYLKNIGIIVEKDNDFEWRNIDRLNNLTIHSEIEKLLEERFNYYFSTPRLGSKIVRFLGLLYLFETKVNINLLHEIWHRKDFYEVLDFLLHERIIKADRDFIQFDHENIFQYFEKRMADRIQSAAKLIIRWIQIRSLQTTELPLWVRCLNECFGEYSSEFFTSSLKYLRQLRSIEDWKNILVYGEMFLAKVEESDKFFLDFEKFEIMLAIAIVKSEYSDLHHAIQYCEVIESKINQYLFEVGSATKVIKLPELLLLFRTILLRAEMIIMASDYLAARKILNSLVAKILQFQKKNKEYENTRDLIEIICWSYNRIGITYKGTRDEQQAINLLEKSLRIAKKIDHDYYIHHNYYDLGGCFFQLNEIETGHKMHLKSLRPVLDSSDQINAKIRTQIRTGLFNIFLSKYEVAEFELEDAIQLARERNYLWELTRGLINQAGLYFLERKFETALEVYKTCLHYIDTLNAEGFNLSVNNNLGFLYLHYYKITQSKVYLKKSLEYFLIAIQEARGAEKLIDFASISTYRLIVLLNLFKYKIFLDSENIHIHENGEALKQINLLHKELDALMKSITIPPFFDNFQLSIDNQLSFYLVFMSFS